MSDYQLHLIRRFRVFSFAWLIFSLFAVQYYAERVSGIEGIFMHLFLYGVFAAPVWLYYCWSYLYADESVSMKFFSFVTIAYGFWSFLDKEISYTESSEIILISYVAFIVIAYPNSFLADWISKQKLKAVLQRKVVGATVTDTERKMIDVVKFLKANELPADYFNGKDLNVLFDVIEMLKIQKLPFNTMKGRDIYEIDKKISDRLAKEVFGYSPDTPKENRPCLDLAEITMPMIKIFQEEWDFPKK
jgi:hypothetical protein